MNLSWRRCCRNLHSVTPIDLGIGSKNINILVMERAEETLIVPVKDGVTVKVGEAVQFKELTPQQLLDMGLRFIEAAKEGMR